MKKLLLSGLLVGLTASAFAQGQVAIRNIFNNDPSSAATANGLVFLGSTPIATDFNMQIYGGATAGSLTLLGSYIGATAVGINAFGAGTFFTPDVGTVSGATATAFFRIDAWTGSATDFNSATTKGTTGVFSNALGNPNASPPATPAELAGMPALVIAVPEPGTFALAGLGAAALLIFRRRK